MRLGSHALRTSGIVAAMGLCLSLLVNTGVAYASCIPNRTADGITHWVGYGSVLKAYPPGLQGVKANINTYFAFVHPDYPNGPEEFSYAWVMLTTGYNWTWAQIGPESKPNNNYTTYSWAWGCTNCWDRTRKLAGVEGSTNEYKVTWNASTGDFKFWIDGGFYATKNITAWVPQAAQISGELTDRISQMMGDTSEIEGFGPSFYRLGDNNTPWTVASGSRVNVPGNPVFGIAGSAPVFGIWDPCP